MHIQVSTENRIAGADSTAITLTFALYFTLENRNIWDRLSENIRGAFKVESDINSRTVATIPYLTGVIYEGISIHRGSI
jgi:cytochrome P450